MMLDKAITEFLENKIQDFLTKKIKPKTSEEDKVKFLQEANNKYELGCWLKQMMFTADNYFTTHPAKFVHSTPLSKASKYKAKDLNIIAVKSRVNDGLLKTGNVDVDTDLSGYPDNGNSTELYNFLRLKLEDNNSVIEHLKDNTEYIKQQLGNSSIDYEDLRKSLLPKEKNSLITSERLKQVYFPTNNDYHLLSILTPSGVIYKLKQRVDEFRFSQKNKKLREAIKKNSSTPLKGKIQEIYDLTCIRYGGTNAQNVSVLNNQNRGISYLLASTPPKLTKRKVQPPKTSFFDDCLWAGLFNRDFNDFHKVLQDRKNNKKIRDTRDDIVLNSISKVKWLIQQIRDIGSNWSDTDTYNGLEMWQKIWLDEKYQGIRDDSQHNQNYIDNAQKDFANWFIGNYKHSVEGSKLLGNDDIDHIKVILKQEKELLR